MTSETLEEYIHINKPLVSKIIAAVGEITDDIIIACMFLKTISDELMSAPC
jgi:plasmid maintenance system antidote protein VapI